MGSRIVWVVSEKPKGQYRSFQGRQWPSAFLDNKDGKIIFHIVPVDKVTQYWPSLAEETELQVRIMDWRGERPIWRVLRRVCHGVKSAKRHAVEFLELHPEYMGD